MSLSAQVPRPLAMKKEGIQTRKRKPKNLNKTQAGQYLNISFCVMCVCVCVCMCLYERLCV